MLFLPRNQSDEMKTGLVIRNSLLGVTGFGVGLLILALAPTLLRQTSFDVQRLKITKVRLIALQEEDLSEAEQRELEPEPPPEPEVLDPPEMEPPELEMPEIETPQTPYESISPSYDNIVQLPSLTGIGVNGVQVAPQNFTRKLARGPLPGLPRHAPPRTRFNPDEVDKMPQPVATAQPMYPYRAKRMGIEGMVRIRFLVNTSGRVDLVKVLESKPAGEFDLAVQKTAKNWKFKPAMKDGQAVETWVETNIQFKLK